MLKNNIYINKLVLILVILQLSFNIFILTNHNNHDCEYCNSHLEDIIDKNIDSIVTIIDGSEFDSHMSGNSMSIGTGIVYNEQGLIITNYHVVKIMQAISVVTNDGQLLNCSLIAFDKESDIALLQTNKKMKSAIFSTKNMVKPGQEVIAIGTPIDITLHHSVSKGIVSGCDRFGSTPYSLIQSDVALSPGYSGGALINLDGEVIGVISYKNNAPGSEGLTFSLEIADVLNIASQLEEYGRIKQHYTGLTVSESFAQQIGLTSDSGLLVTAVSEGSPGELAGIIPQDIILEANGQKIRNERDYVNTIKSIKENDHLTLLIQRNDNIITIILIPFYL